MPSCKCKRGEFEYSLANYTKPKVKIGVEGAHRRRCKGMSGLPQTIVSSSKPVNRERRGTGTTLVRFSQVKYAWKVTLIPAHSLPHSSYCLVKLMEAVV